MVIYLKYLLVQEEIVLPAEVVMIAMEVEIVKKVWMLNIKNLAQRASN